MPSSTNPAGDEAGQKAQKDSGPDSWQFWNKQNEAGQTINRRGGGGNSGPDSWQFWAPNRQLLATGGYAQDLQCRCCRADT